MPKAKNPLADKAETLYRQGKLLKDIAADLGVPESTVRRWKSTYKWDSERSDKNTERSDKKSKRTQAKVKAAKEDVDQLIKNPKLTDKQRMFCVYYVKCFNASKAYRKAYGCDEYSALASGPRLLGKVSIKAEITRLKQAKLNRAMLAEEDVFQKYMDIAFSDITDYVDFGQEVKPVMSAFGPVMVKNEETGEKIPVTKIVNTVRFKESYEVDGTLIQEVGQGKDGAKIKLMDKQKALDWLANHMDMATDEQRARIDQFKARTARITGDDAEVEDMNDIEGEIYGND